VSVSAISPVLPFRAVDGLSSIHTSHMAIITENTRRKNLGLEPVYPFNPWRPIPADLCTTPFLSVRKTTPKSPVKVEPLEINYEVGSRCERFRWEIRQLGDSLGPWAVQGFVWAMWKGVGNDQTSH